MSSIRIPAEALEHVAQVSDRISARGVKVRRMAVIVAALEKGLPIVEAEAYAPAFVLDHGLLDVTPLESSKTPRDKAASAVEVSA